MKPAQIKPPAQSKRSSQAKLAQTKLVQTVLSAWVRGGSSNQENIHRGRGSSVRRTMSCGRQALIQYVAGTYGTG